MINPFNNLPDGCTLAQINGNERPVEPRFRGSESAVFSDDEQMICLNPFCCHRMGRPARAFVSDDIGEPDEDHCRECQGMFTAQRQSTGGILMTFTGEFKDEI